jgi:hypothetical protein
MTTAAAPPTDLKDTLDEMRASVAARGARKGLQGKIQAAILDFLDVLMRLLMEFRAGGLAPLAPVADERATRTDGAVGNRAPEPREASPSSDPIAPGRRDSGSRWEEAKCGSATPAMRGAQTAGRGDSAAGERGVAGERPRERRGCRRARPSRTLTLTKRRTTDGRWRDGGIRPAFAGLSRPTSVGPAAPKRPIFKIWVLRWRETCDHFVPLSKRYAIARK